MSITKKGSKKANTESDSGKYAEGLAAPEKAIRDSRVRIVIDFMNGSLHRKLVLSELGEVVNLSSSHLSHLFKAQTGLSVGEYLRRLRMERARYLLATSLLSIKQIMGKVGYNSKSHFVRHFRRSLGFTPSEYRKNIQLDNGKQPVRSAASDNK